MNDKEVSKRREETMEMSDNKKDKIKKFSKAAGFKINRKNQ